MHESLGLLKGIQMFNAIGQSILIVGLPFSEDFRKIELKEAERIVGIITQVEYDTAYSQCLFNFNRV